MKKIKELEEVKNKNKLKEMKKMKELKETKNKKELEKLKKKEDEKIKKRKIDDENIKQLEELIKKQKNEKIIKKLEEKKIKKPIESKEKGNKEKEEKNENKTNYLLTPVDNKNYIKNEINDESNNNKNILNEYNKTKLIKEEVPEKIEEPVIDKFKNTIFNKILGIINNKNLSEKVNLSDGKNKENNKKNTIKKIDTKIMKSIELSDIIKNADLFLSESNKDSTSNLIQKFEYTKAIDKIIKDEIEQKKDGNLITPDEAVYYIENNIIRFYGYFGSELIYKNIKTFIEKTPTNEILRKISFKILTSKLAFQKVLNIVIENKELKSFIDNDESVFDKYFEELKILISKQFQISEKDIFYFSPNIYNYEQNLIIYNQKNIEGLEDLLKSENLNVSTSLLLNNIILSPCIFEQNFCKADNSWSKKKSRRGGREYIPPLGWFGISMKVTQKYEKNMTWLGKQNISGEWVVAYHAIGNGNIFSRILDILDGNLKNEEIKLYKRDKNIEKNNNKYPFCGEGLYCCPEIQDVEKFAEKKSLGYFNIKFQFALMNRVNPTEIRNPGEYPVCWILSGNDEEIRPYRLLFKICSN